MATLERVELPDFWVPLTIGQAQHVVRQALGGGPGSGMLRVLLALSGAEDRPALYELQQDERYQDRTLSQSTICCLLALTAFDDGQEHGVKAVASELGMTVTTTLRYLKTWVAIGVLEQVSKTRRYRLAIRWRHHALTSRPRPALPAVT